MTREEINSMAKEAGWTKAGRDMEYPALTDRLERFITLYERRLIEQGWRQCAEGQITTQYCGLLELAVAAEREACAQVCEEAALKNWYAEDCVAIIRARGEQ
jgi:hypothetical protein